MKLRRVAIVLASVSVGPPAANGTTKVIGLTGYSPAPAAAAQERVAITEANNSFLMSILLPCEEPTIAV